MREMSLGDQSMQMEYEKRIALSKRRSINKTEPLFFANHWHIASFRYHILTFNTLSFEQKDLAGNIQNVFSEISISHFEYVFTEIRQWKCSNSTGSNNGLVWLGKKL